MPFQDLGTGFSGIGPGGFGAVTAPPGQKNMVAHILSELGRDVGGALKVTGATGGELWALLAGSAPLRFEDLDTRDIKGALMVAAMGAGGLAAGSVRGALALPNTVLGRAAGTTISEAAAGAAFGLIRPIDEDEERLKAIMGDTMWGAGIGAGASMTKSAVMATVGARIAAYKAHAARIRIGQAAAMEHDAAVAREVAGIQLLNPTSSERISIRRAPDGRKIESIVYGGDKARAEDLGQDFGEAVARAIREGFTAELQPWRPHRALKGLDDILDPRVMEAINAADGNIIEAVGNIDLARYRAIREAAELSTEARGLLESVVGEVLVPSTPLGDVGISRAAKDGLTRLLKLKPDTPDAVVVREAFKKGLISVENVADGVKVEDMLFEVMVNGLQPEGSMMIVNQMADIIGASVLTTRRITKLFPEVQPIFDAASTAIHALRSRKEATQQWLHELRLLPKEAAERGVDIIEAAGRRLRESFGDLPATPETYRIAREEAVDAARATGDPGVIRFVEEVTERLGTYRDELISTGILQPDAGIVGYFPIVNTNKWRLDIKGAGREIEFQGMWPTREDALREAARVQAQAGGGLQGTVSPVGVTFDRSDLGLMDPKALARTKKAITEGMTEALEDLFPAGGRVDAKGIVEAAMGASVRPMPAAPKRSTPHARKRELGLRDFSKDPFEALETYAHSVERALELRNFEPTAQKVLDALPPEQRNLRLWGEKYIDHIMGRPGLVERQTDVLLQHLGLDVAPRALSRWMGAVRKWETFARLSNPLSAAVNLTQIVLNTGSVLGAADTARGLEVIMGGYKTTNARMLRLKDAGLDLGMYIPLSEAGNVGTFDTPLAALREKRFAEAFFRMSMFFFNGSEKMNRMVTAWGAFKKGLRDGLDDKGAAAYAQTIVERTQFDYGAHNMPAVLNSPLGGVLFQFKSFVLNEIDFIASLSPKELARFSAAAHTMGGVALLMNMPGTDILDAASGLFFEEKFSEMIRLEGGKPGQMNRWALFGLPGTFGVDMSDYLGVGSFSEITRSLFGPGPGDAQALVTFIKEAAGDIVSQGRVANVTKNAFMERAAPTILRRARRAWDIAETGDLRNPYTGKLIYKPENRAREAVLTALGPPTLELQAERAAEAVHARLRERYIRARNTFTKEAALAALQQRPEDVREIIHEAHAAGHIINAADLRYWIKEMSTPAGARRQRRTPQGMREDHAALFDVTGLHHRPQELGGLP